MLPQSEFDSPNPASAPAPVAIAAFTQDRALIGLLRSVVDPSTDLLLVNSEPELVSHLHSRRVSVALLDSMFIEADLAALAERLRQTWSDLVLVVVGTAEEQSKVASQITSGVVYRFLHRPVSAPRVRLFVEAALRRHEVENVEQTLEQTRPDFSRFETARSESAGGRGGSSLLIALGGLVLAGATVGGWYFLSGGKDSAGAPESAQVVSQPADATPPVKPAAEAPAAATPAAETASAPAAPAREEALASREPAAESAPPAAHRQAASPAPAPTPAPVAAPASTVAATRSETTERVQRTIESAVEATPTSPPPPAPMTHEQRLKEQLAQAEAALQRGDYSTPAGRSAVDLFRGALELDPGNALAKAGLVRVADRLLVSAERALTAGRAAEAKRMVDVAEQLTPATERAAFLTMQIDMEKERAALTAKRDSDAQDKLARGETYLRLANTRLRSGALVDPPEDNARFYLEAARQIVAGDPALAEVTRTLQKEMLTRAGAAATAGNAAETERWLANIDGTGNVRPDMRQEMTEVRRILKETLLGARADRTADLAKSFNTSLTGGRLLQPADGSAKHYLFQLIASDPSNTAVASARQSLGQAYVREMRGALGRGDIAAADAWLTEARTISYSGSDLNAVVGELTSAREAAAQRASVVGANSLARVKYVPPKFPAATRNRNMNGWVELEFTVRTDGTTGDIVVTNSNPRKTFDAAAVNAVEQWVYKPVMRGRQAVDQRAAVRIRFAEE